jgi:hypothetical protein
MHQAAICIRQSSGGSRKKKQPGLLSSSPVVPSFVREQEKGWLDRRLRRSSFYL